jgi:hypothetical protein
MTSRNGIAVFPVFIGPDHRVDRFVVVNVDPARCPMRSCDELAACGDRCSCPPCHCPDCLTRRARARARHGEPDDPTTLF